MMEWRNVVGYEGLYEVSSDGQVRRITGIDAQARLWPGRILKQHIDTRGYFMLSLSKDGVRSHALPHRLVAMAFLGPIPPGKEVCHNNGIRTDNRVENLRIDTRSANIFDSVAHGTHYKARQTTCPQGHEYGRISVLASGYFKRVCRTCEAAGVARYRERKRLAIQQKT